MDSEQDNTGRRIIFFALLLALISMFTTWSEKAVVLIKITGRDSQFGLYGYENDGWILLISFIYPTFKAYMKEKMSKIIGFICGFIPFIYALIFLSSNWTVSIIDQTGPLFLIGSSFFLIYGVWKNS